MRCAILKLASGIGAVDGTRPFAFTTDPRDHRPESVGPPTSHCLQYRWAEGDARLGALGGRTGRRAFAGLHLSKNTGKGRGIRQGGAKSEGAGDGEIPGLLAAAGSPRDDPAGRLEEMEGSGGSGSGGRSLSTCPGGSGSLASPGQQRGWAHRWRQNEPRLAPDCGG